MRVTRRYKVRDPRSLSFSGMIPRPQQGIPEVARSFALLGLRCGPSCGNSGPLQSFTAFRYLRENDLDSG